MKWKAVFAGREGKILAAIGILWPPARGRHIHCPFPEHEDKHPSWRWSDKKKKWYCTCGSGSIFDAIMRKYGVTFVESVKIAREIIGDRHDSNRKSGEN